MMKRSAFWIFLAVLSTATGLLAQENTNTSKFRQMYDLLPTPNGFRTASGAPGPDYWQQRADYSIEAILDDTKQRIESKETITYTNNLPDVLSYLWLQLDQNTRTDSAETYSTMETKLRENAIANDLRWIDRAWKEGGYHIFKVTDTKGEALNYHIEKTMMRVELPQPLLPKKKVSFKVEWGYNINDRAVIDGRSGYEHFEENDNCLYTIAQWFPRMAQYSDVEGWQNKQFLGKGEFSLPYGDYSVKLTVPSDHVVGATGKLQNAKDVLSAEQQRRLKEAETAERPVLVITPEEATENEKGKSPSSKTWHFKAENVRDFAFASSRQFIWDAMGVKIGGKTVIAQSLYPKEGNPLWAQYSTEVVAHTLKSYSKNTGIDYPYPQSTAVHAASIGMEYPMICFNFGRPHDDGTYSAKTKYDMIGVIIHEVGHNFFPMIINSDERQWTWMDEGMNTFLEYRAEQEWERGFPKGKRMRNH